MSLLFQLEQTQWWPAATIADHQFRQLDLLLDHVERSVPFYAERLGALGRSTASDITAERWRRMPILTRAEAQEAAASLVSDAVPPDHGPTFPLRTSGSTGRPLRTLGTALTQLFWICLTLRDHGWHRRDLDQKLAVIRQFEKPHMPGTAGSVAADWGMTTKGVVHTGGSVALHIDRTVREQADWLRRELPGYLLTYPSNAYALAGHFSRHGEALPGLLEVRTFGEVVDQKVRVACQEAFGVPLVDVYSSQEVGYVALQCPDHEQYHVQSEHLLVEVLDDDGEPCPPGQIGRVVATTLHNFATPLLRYAVGDYAEVGEPCPCGRGLPVLTRVLGRQRNMFTLPDGDQFWPSFGDPSDFKESLSGLPRLQQFQVIQRSVNDLEVKVVTERPFRTEEEHVMRDYLVTSLGHPFTITFSYVSEIPRGTGGKFEDFRSQVGR